MNPKYFATLDLFWCKKHKATIAESSNIGDIASVEGRKDRFLLNRGELDGGDCESEFKAISFRVISVSPNKHNT